MTHAIITVHAAESHNWSRGHVTQPTTAITTNHHEWVATMPHDDHNTSHHLTTLWVATCIHQLTNSAPPHWNEFPRTKLTSHKWSQLPTYEADCPQMKTNAHFLMHKTIGFSPTVIQVQHLSSIMKSLNSFRMPSILDPHRFHEQILQWEQEKVGINAK